MEPLLLKKRKKVTKWKRKIGVIKRDLLHKTTKVKMNTGKLFSSRSPRPKTTNKTKQTKKTHQELSSQKQNTVAELPVQLKTGENNWNKNGRAPLPASTVINY